MKKIIMITVAATCLCACNESVKYTSPCASGEPARCTDDYHYAQCSANGYTTRGCCDEAAISAGTCDKLCIMHDNGASCENAPKSHTVTPQPQPQPKPAECGNGIIESGEQCDGALLGGHSCADRYGSNAKGYVGCDPTTCKVKYDNCEPDAANCGNGVLDEGEDCDGDLMRNEDCDSIIDDAAGKLKCTNRCKYDVTECRVSLCGNGVVDPGEECDTTVPRNMTCNDVVHATLGTLSCNAQCQLDISKCTKPKAGDLCDDSGFMVCDGNVSVQCTDGVIYKTDCGAYSSKSCVELNSDSSYLSGCISDYLECDQVGAVSWQCESRSSYISREMTCLKNMASDKNYWYFLDEDKVEVCPYSCDYRTGGCARLVPEQDTRCDSSTFQAYCDGNIAVTCEENITMSSVHATMCDGSCGIFGTGNNRIADCIMPNTQCNKGDPDKTICVNSYLVSMRCTTTADGSQAGYRLKQITVCPNGCDPDATECVKLDASEGTRCTASTKDKCLDNDVLLYCNSSGVLATRACKIDGKGLCLEDDFGVDCRDTCTKIGEKRTTCISDSSGSKTKYEVCVEADGQLVFETEKIETCGWMCNADSTGCFDISEREGERCSRSECDGETLLYCSGGRYVAYYCPMYDQVCVDDPDYGSYCMSKCLKDEKYSVCIPAEEYALKYTYTCTQDAHGVSYAKEVGSPEVCWEGCNETADGCL